MSRVQTPAARPKLVSLPVSTTSSSELNGIAHTTGPKISSRTTFMSGVVSVSTGGSTKYPRSPPRPPPAAAPAPTPAPGGSPRARLEAGRHVADHLVALLGGGQRPHLGGGVEARADLDLL